MAGKLGGTAIIKRKDRFILDSYFTPPIATEKLLEKINIEGKVWECASGLGHISKVLESHGHEVVSSDIREDAYGTKHDFFESVINVDNIITNPPYSLAIDFIEHGLKCVNKKLILLLRLAFLESQARMSMFKSTPLSNVLILSKRLPHWDGEKFIKSGQFSHAWFVWDKENFNGRTTLDWI